MPPTTEAAQLVANALYKDWGLLAALATLVAPLIPGLWFLHRRKHDDVIESILRIRVALVGAFQKTVLEEVGKFFKLVSIALPSLLAKRIVEKDNSSAFGLLCKKLREIKDDPDDDELSEILQVSLAATVTAEIDRVISIASSHVDGERKPSGIAAEVRVAFEESTETKLGLVAQKLSEAEGRENRYFSSNRHTVQAIGGALIFYLLAWVCAFFKHEYAQYCAYVFLGGLFLSVALAAFFFVRCHQNKDWLRNEATSLSSTATLEEEQGSKTKGEQTAL